MHETSFVLIVSFVLQAKDLREWLFHSHMGSGSGATNSSGSGSGSGVGSKKLSGVSSGVDILLGSEFGRRLCIVCI